MSSGGVSGGVPSVLPGDREIAGALTVDQDLNVGGAITTTGGAIAGFSVTAVAYLDLLPVAGQPGAPTSGWRFYVDANDGNKLKAVAATGTNGPITIGTP